VRISKEAILEMLYEQGDDDVTARADRDLPEEVDTDRDAAALAKLGLDPEDLLQRVVGEEAPEPS
jgi:hypothetical protein